MLEQRLQQQFFDCADLIYSCAETLGRSILDAIDALLGSITSGGKVLTFGEGDCALHAQHLANKLLCQFERDRPGLAALALATNGTDLWLRQLETLGQPGDVILVFAAAEAGPGLLSALSSARTKDLTVIAITGCTTRLKDMLAETDVHISIPHDRKARIHEVQWLILHSLCDAVDLQLLGENENP
ncbi:MAG: SIS domain-containing protein [Burkholderiales bacterium]|jgi:D-sedoheptulose 7-phosphate isomerase